VGSGLTFQVWIDAQLPPSLAHWLQADTETPALHVEQLGHLGSKDESIFRAARESGYPVVLISKDEDFRRLVGQYGPPPQIVWIRCGNVSNPELRRILLTVWPRVTSLLAAGEPLVEVRRHTEVEARAC